MLVACVGGPGDGATGTGGAGTKPAEPGAVPPVDVLPVTPPVIAPPAPPDMDGELGPDILLPKADSVDVEVARVGDLVLRQSHAYRRLLSAHPKLALAAVDLLVFDVLVARHAEQFGIHVSEERVEQLAVQEEQELRKQVETELGDMKFDEYVWRLFGMREQDWRLALRLRTAQRLYQGYVLRYLALREDRVRVRFLMHKDEAVAREVVDKVRVGADFATLALRWSEDPSRRDGGLLPPFGRAFRHPAGKHAFELEPGEVTAPYQVRWGGEPRWFVAYCIEHRPGREVPFKDVRDEIDVNLEKQPITPLETAAYTLRWRSDETEAAPANESAAGENAAGKDSGSGSDK